MGGMFGGPDTSKAEKQAKLAEERQAMQQAKLRKEEVRERQKEAGRKRAITASSSGQTLYKSTLGVGGGGE